MVARGKDRGRTEEGMRLISTRKVLQWKGVPKGKGNANASLPVIKAPDEEEERDVASLYGMKGSGNSSEGRDIK
uniref:Uncharacterized protein n=1 Tax=Pristionchus pacificus TaxID=54126 RepID=A0A2A6BRB1_PRIPA|eukprot:PDM68291.1 hypothetical protein PRIPAC_46335 [Pristionchus pacificus]